MNAKALAQVLSLSSKQYSINIKKIKLNDNSIVSSRGMHPMIWMKGLKDVDLRTNEVKCFNFPFSIFMLNKIIFRLKI